MISKIFLFPFKLIVFIPIYLFKFLISPLLPHTCRFYPTCSTYCLKAVQEFGVFKGLYYGIKRILRCTPNNKKSGYDPVPINLKGVKKWIF